jgi:hypothetical protein
LHIPKNKLATEWELHQILNDPDFLKNTIFHENGKVLDAVELAKRGIKQKVENYILCLKMCKKRK